MNLDLFRSMGDEAAGYVGYYLAYILLNFVSLLLCLLLFDSIATFLGGHRPSAIILYAFFIFLVSNEITKAFFWTAHQQFFSLLTPLLSIWLALRIKAQGTTLKNIKAYSLVCGILMLVYGSFLTMFASIVIVAYLTDKKLHLPHLLINTLLFLLPTLCWVTLCIWQNGHYYNHEVEQYRQLVWVADIIEIPFEAFLALCGKHFSSYLNTFGEVLIFLAPGVAALTLLLRNKGAESVMSAARIIAICGLVIFLFFMILGFYEERLTFTLFPVALCAIFLFIAVRLRFRFAGVVSMFAAIAWHLYNCLSYGPFS